MKTDCAIFCSTLLIAGLLVSHPAQGSEPPPSSEEVAPEPEPAPEPVEAACVPACRDGYLCIEGDCVSACNPPCDPGQTCNSDGSCSAESAASTVVIVPPTNACVSDSQCRHPRTCEAGQCQVTSTYLTALLSEARTATIVGAVMMSVGAAIMIGSSGAFATGLANKRRGESDDDAYLAGYTVLGIGGVVLISGSIPLAVGGSKKRRWKAYTAERETATP